MLRAASRSPTATSPPRATSTCPCQPGELVTLIGPSGCGKSTVLRLVAGLERPDAGRDPASPATRWPGRGAFVHAREAPGRAGLPGPRAVPAPRRDPQRRASASTGCRAPSAAGRVAEVLALVRLGHLAKRYPHELSGGEQQRVALARALAPAARRRTPRRAVLLPRRDPPRPGARRDWSACSATPAPPRCFVTHDQTEALSVGDRVVVMHDGRIEQADTPQSRLRAARHPLRRLVHGRRGLPARARARRAAHLRDRRRLHGPRLGQRRRDVDVVLRPHEVALRARPRRARRRGGGRGVPRRVRAAHRPAGLGQTVRSWQPHSVRHPVGTRVSVASSPGVTPTLLVGDGAVTSPPS